MTDRTLQSDTPSLNALKGGGGAGPRGGGGGGRGGGTGGKGSDTEGDEGWQDHLATLPAEWLESKDVACLPWNQAQEAGARYLLSTKDLPIKEGASIGTEQYKTRFPPTCCNQSEICSEGPNFRLRLERIPMAVEDWRCLSDWPQSSNKTLQQDLTIPTAAHVH